ncbi:hypothetical protein QJU11_09930 [Pasteurella atlantica]|uniref:hypothetical protein n=1 Tax=Phocoenobacter atlanticus TaxID=3416742 RepID=UPI00275FCF7D|nr:hypothetical protein [Pasteurella atlantica]MDP8042509.1 hypothetical protein [Pasteurella atlantica]
MREVCIVGGKYIQNSGDSYRAFRVNYYTEFEDNDGYSRPFFKLGIKANYFVSWGAYCDGNTIYTSGYSTYWFKTIDEVNDFLERRH